MSVTTSKQGKRKRKRKEEEEAFGRAVAEGRKGVGVRLAEERSESNGLVRSLLLSLGQVDEYGEGAKSMSIVSPSSSSDASMSSLSSASATRFVARAATGKGKGFTSSSPSSSVLSASSSVAISFLSLAFILFVSLTHRALHLAAFVLLTFENATIAAYSPSPVPSESLVSTRPSLFTKSKTIGKGSPRLSPASLGIRREVHGSRA